MSTNTTYIYDRVWYDTEELAQSAAQQKATNIHNVPCLYSTTTVVTAHPTLHNAWIVNPDIIDFDCRQLDADDTRHFNISSNVSGDTITAVQVAELKQANEVYFNQYVAHGDLIKIFKFTYPADASIIPNEDNSSTEIIATTVNFT